MTQLASTQTDVHFYDYLPQSFSVLEEVIEGLSQKPSFIHPKFFYDNRGSLLFDQICRCDEYYITRCELEILKQYKNDISHLIGDKSIIIEPGGGNSQKVRLLLDALKPKAYVPIDISSQYLANSARLLAEDYPGMTQHVIFADYMQPLPIPLPLLNSGLKLIIFFPGSSIGNFEPEQMEQFLRYWAEMLKHSNCGFLIGIDIKKPKDILEAAYNDSTHFTADFNLNILNVINQLTRSNFDSEKFTHDAFYNQSKGRIEMHLRSFEQQSVQIGNKIFTFKPGDTIHTENSYKYSIDEFQQIATATGLTPQQVWQDNKQLFSLHYLTT